MKQKDNKIYVMRLGDERLRMGAKAYLLEEDKTLLKLLSPPSPQHYYVQSLLYYSRNKRKINEDENNVGRYRLKKQRKKGEIVMAIKLGHAVASEHSNKYGKAGNQNGKELRFQDWYDGKWNVVLRPIDDGIAEKIAKAMEQAVNNRNVGYCQEDRTTLYTQAEKRNWQIHLITTRCECDCSSLVAVCVNASGIKVSKDIYTGNMVNALIKTSKFEKLTDKKYRNEDSYLKRGDILVCEGSHTAVVLSNGDKLVNVDYDVVNYNGNVTAFWLNVREGASSKTKSLKTIKKDTLVTITKEKDGWGYTEEYDGWVSLTYIKKDTSQVNVEPYVASTTTTVNFRTAPNSSVSNNIITKFNKGQVLLITKKNNEGWVYGKTTIDNVEKEGWIFKDYLSKVNENKLEKRVVTDATGLNIRAKGNSSATILGAIPSMEIFYIVKDNNETWGVVVYKDILGYSNLSKLYSVKV